MNVSYPLETAKSHKTFPKRSILSGQSPVSIYLPEVQCILYFLSRNF